MKDYDTLKQYTQDYNYIPVKKEILSDVTTPIELLRILRGVSPHVFILESVMEQESWGRYTFLGYNPKLCITCSNNHLKIYDANGSLVLEEVVREPKAHLKDILDKYKSPKLKDYPSFTGGLVGYFSFDYIKYAEPKLNLDADDTEGFKDFDLMLFDKVIAFDNLKQKIVIIANAPADNFKDSYKQALTDIDEIIRLIQNGKKADIPKGELLSDYRALFSEEEFCQKVNKAKDYIYEGDIFQVVLSNRLEADFKGSLFDTYRILRTLNPSPYMFYFSGDDMEVAGASPETLVKLEDGVLHTFPLAGTRPRGKNESEDKRLEEELLKDEKELSEHNMLVDLGRNDIGRISKFGSVEVEKYMEVLRFSHVMHIGSTVKGELNDNKSPVDVIDAILPAGTLSGAPKIRACEIINELENNKRGIYGGAIGYIDFTGNLDTAIAIRIAYKKNNKVFVRSGAGIVADSNPINEYNECINKAKAVMLSIEKASKMED
ncbi:MAG: anthranilate synthase component I [Lachnospiraceae bacterium]|nr:anthranilate synthase component I [Lachnospiraceae bacterium]